MTGGLWGRRRVAVGTGPQLAELLSASLDRRFSLDLEVLAARVRACAEAAGTTPEEFASRACLDDLYLATACAAGEADAWAECERKHFAFVRAFAHRFLPDAAARDLADQVIADLWQRGTIARYAGRSTLRTWLGSVVAHAAINARRSAPSGDTRATPRPAGPSAAGPEDAPAERLLATLVTQAISALPAEDKLLLQLYYERGLTLDEMEPLLRASKATLSRRLKALRGRLRAAVDDLTAHATGTTAQAVREGLMLERVEFDLSALLRPRAAMEGPGSDSV